MPLDVCNRNVISLPADSSAEKAAKQGAQGALSAAGHAIAATASGTGARRRHYHPKPAPLKGERQDFEVRSRQLPEMFLQHNVAGLARISAFTGGYDRLLALLTRIAAIVAKCQVAKAPCCT